MGNEQIKAAQARQNFRRNLIPTNEQPSYNEEPIAVRSGQRKYSTINQSLEIPTSRDNYKSLDVSYHNQDKSVRSQKTNQKATVDTDKVLAKLSQKNEEMRRELKNISEELTQKLKFKKFVPKKKGKQNEQDQEDENSVNLAGMKRELQNAYRQIEMYKRTITSMRGKEEHDGSNVRLARLENQIPMIDANINAYIDRIEAIRKVKKVQDKFVEKDINDDLQAGVDSMKKEADSIRNKLKELANRERQREINYKKQQAYLLEVERKWRAMNGDYFPEIKKKSAPVAAIRNSRAYVVKQEGSTGPSERQFQEVTTMLAGLKQKHEDYHKKIDNFIILKNKIMDQQIDVNNNIEYSEKVIETLKLKLVEIKKIAKPTKKSLFGYDNYEGSELQSQYNGGVSEIQKEIEEQINQDQFDIKHLIANIPKPIRQRSVDYDDAKDPKLNKEHLKKEASDKVGMKISNEKSEPKKWGSSMTRSEEKGRYIKKQLIFDDGSQFQVDVKPLIIGINVWVNKNNIILGIQAIYLNSDEIRYGSKSLSSADGFLIRYDLQSPDYLKNIAGAFSEEGYLEYLALYSKKGKTGSFGVKKESQELFNFGLSSTERPFRIGGASFTLQNQARINRLAIEICHEQ